MEPLIGKLILAFKMQEGMSITYIATGSGGGFAELFESRVDLVASSRKISNDEIRNMANAFGSIGVRHLIAKDAMAVCISPRNPLRNISKTALDSLFSCKIKNWQYFGLPFGDISILVREKGTGTLNYIKNSFGFDSLCSSIEEIDSNTEIIKKIKEDDHHISLISSASTMDVNKTEVDGSLIFRNGDLNRSYPLVRELFFYSPTTPKPEVRDFLDFCFSKKAQKIIQKEGFISIWK